MSSDFPKEVKEVSGASGLLSLSGTNRPTIDAGWKAGI